MLKRYLLVCSFILASVTAEANLPVNINLSISAAPPPAPAQVVVTPPHGYTNCYITQSMWVNNIWIPAHQECVYPEAGGSSVWVSGYWGCLTPGRHGRCARWKWHGNHWMRGAHGHVHGHHDHSVHEHPAIQEHHGREHEHGHLDEQQHHSHYH